MKGNNVLSMGGSPGVSEYRRTIKRILTREDSRIAIFAGPCSLAFVESDKRFIDKYSGLTSRNNDSESPFFYALRGYGEKPRSTTGWEGIIKNPIIDGKVAIDVDRGIDQYLEIVKYALKQNVPVVAEVISEFDRIRNFVDPYLAMGFLGARNCESTSLRALLASKDFPIGAKHSQYDSTLSSGLEALIALNHGDELTVSTESLHKRSKPNPFAAIVLRGTKQGPNYDSSSILSAIGMLEKLKQKKQIRYASIIIDCSHANSNKCAEKQRDVFHSVIDSLSDERIRKCVSGLAFEVNRHAGRQNISKDMVPGISCTDECMGFEEFKNMILEKEGVLIEKYKLAS